jgi:NADP-dependent 3-hydroxy acid dehydrogenase YdfG
MNATSSSDRKVILITGASTGFGRDTAESLHRAGHRVFASMRDIDGRNRAHADALRGLSIDVLELDVTDQASVDSAVAQLLSKAGRIDVLVNNAGIASAGVTESFTTKQAQALFDVNVFGVMRTTRAVLPALREQGRGLIINVGSILGRVTFPFFGIYGASKFALEAWSDSLRYELSGLGVEVALVQPSAYPTSMYSSVQQPAEPAVALAYGPTGEIPGAMFQHFTSLFAAADAPKPHEVSQAIAKLVATPGGQRPARTIVGAPFGADAVNASTALAQAGVVRGLGLGHLDVAAAT